MKRFCSITFALIILIVAPVIAAAADCPVLVEQALAATETLCSGTGKNQACYGNINLTAKPNPAAEDFRFDEPGDRVNLSDVRSLQLSPMTVDKGEWGVALMNLDASLPAARTTSVTLLAFGDVMLENTVADPTAVDITVTASSNINVRLLPSLKAGVIGTLKPNAAGVAVERLADGSWLRVKLPDTEQLGWVSSEFVTSDGDLSTLNVVDGSQPYYRPMQAFTFRSGTSSQGCAEIPEDGLIIQTPEGAGEVQLWINQVVVKLGSTVYFQAQPNSDMTITTLEGHATVEAQGVTYTAVAGSRVSVKLDANMQPVEPPRMPEAYAMTDVANLPVGHLQREITIHEPLTPGEINDAQLAFLGCPGNSCENSDGAAANCCPDISTTDSTNNSGGNSDNCPGNSCHNGTNNNNGNSDNCPGNSCHNGTNNNNGNGGGNDKDKDKDKDK